MEQTQFNLLQLTTFLDYEVPKLRVQVRLSYFWGENPRSLSPMYFSALLSCIINMRNAERIAVHIRTHPIYMDPWVDLLVSAPKIRCLNWVSTGVDARTDRM